jgi:hypothetical protein
LELPTRNKRYAEGFAGGVEVLTDKQAFLVTGDINRDPHGFILKSGNTFTYKLSTVCDITSISVWTQGEKKHKAGQNYTLWYSTDNGITFKQIGTGPFVYSDEATSKSRVLRSTIMNPAGRIAASATHVRIVIGTTEENRCVGLEFEVHGYDIRFGANQRTAMTQSEI